MDQREDYAELDARPPWFLRFLFRRALPIGLVVLLIGRAAFLLFGVRASDGNYNTFRSIQKAVDLAAACREYSRRSPDGKFPARLSDLRSTADSSWLVADDEDFKDAWESPFRHAVVANEAGESEPNVWTEWTPG